MTWIIAKREVRNYIKNPILYIGILIIFWGVFQQMEPYLNIHYFSDISETIHTEKVNLLDVDIMDGYIPTTSYERYENGLSVISNVLVEYYDISEEDVNKTIEEIKEIEMTIPEIANYIDEKYSYGDAIWDFEDAKLKKVNAIEANSYMDTMFEKNTYTYYFSRKFSDFLGLYAIFFAIILLAFLFFRDMKKDTYELLHTKPIKARQYIMGKVLGGMITMMLVVCVITVAFDVISVMHGITMNFPVSPLDIWIAVLVYVLPNLFMVICVYACVSLVFKNPLPAVPMLLLYMVYSNMGSKGEDGVFGYHGKFLAILVRFPGLFLSTNPPPMVVFNQISLIFIASVLTLISIIIWKRRRVY